MDLNGHDMYDEVPVLSTYMGHARIYETEKYLNMSTKNSSDIISKWINLMQEYFRRFQNEANTIL